jgi:hypothetical protein
VSEGICVAEGISRAATHFNRKLYQPRPLYDQCKLLDGYPGEGTWVSVGFDVWRNIGHVPRKRMEPHALQPDHSMFPRFEYDEGIQENRWIRSVQDCLEVVGYTDKNYVDIINSWGRYYPHLVRMPVTNLERLWREDGEIGVVTDRV